MPVLAFNFVNQEKLAQALQNADKLSGIILTSPRAVQAVTKALSHLDGRFCYGHARLLVGFAEIDGCDKVRFEKKMGGGGRRV